MAFMLTLAITTQICSAVFLMGTVDTFATDNSFIVVVSRTAFVTVILVLTVQTCCAQTCLAVFLIGAVQVFEVFRTSPSALQFPSQNIFGLTSAFPY